MEKFRNMLETLDVQEAHILRAHVASGAAIQEIDRHLQEQDVPTRICPICERSVNENRDLVLVFGPEGLRQKARFCGHDCLEYFLDRRKQHKPTKALNTAFRE